MNRKVSFESSIYRDSINNLIINDFFKQCDTEEDIRKTFEIEVNRILHLISAIPHDKNIIFHSETKSSRGRIDSEYRNMIFEYKKYNLLSSESQLKKARQQLFDYLKDNKFGNQIVFGFLFDGKQIEIWKKDSTGSIATVDRRLNGLLCSSSLDYVFRTIFLSSTKELSSEAIKEQFSILDYNKNNENKVSLSIFRKLFNMIISSKNKRTKMLFNEWMKMFKLSESDKSEHTDIKKRRAELTRLCGYEVLNAELEYKAIFAMHSSFSIIIKLLLLKMIGEFDAFGKEIYFKDLNSLELLEMKKIFEQIENGELTKQKGLINMLEGDYFSWYCYENWDQEIEVFLKLLILEIDLFEDISMKLIHEVQDLFRELYENFIPPIVRHCFGEYYTPNWLADSVVSKAIDASGQTDINKIRAIDPCCGSGTFLINIIRRRIDSDIFIKKQFNDIINGVVGIDLNPLAILMARINIYINLKPYINDSANLEIPIYLGDSTYSPSIEIIDGIECLTYEMITGEDIIGKSFELIFPYDMVAGTDFIKIIDNFEKYVLTHNSKNAMKYLETLISNLDNKPAIKKAFVNLINEIIELEKKDLNRIWLRIFANYLKTGVQRDFNIVIGNPPWVSWGVLPDNYRKKVKEKCRFEGLFSNDSNTGGNNLNICALIANKCAERWLIFDKGVLGFLMPKSVLFNKSFEGFRNFTVNKHDKKIKLFFQEVDDWSKAGNPFDNVTIPFCTYLVGYNEIKYEEGIKLNVYCKKPRSTINRHLKFEQVKNNFTLIEKGIAVLSRHNNNNFTVFDNKKDLNAMKSIIGNNYYHFRKGVGYNSTQRLRFVKNIDINTAEFIPYVKKGSRLIESNKRIILETKYIRPLIMSYDLSEAGLKWDNNYVIAPYDEFSTQPISDLRLKIESPKLYKYLYDNIEILQKGSDYNKRIQVVDEFYGLLRVGEYSYADFFVAIRDNTRLSTTIVTKITTHWQEIKTPFFDNHISYIAENKKGTRNFIDEIEARKIANILNKPEVNKYILNSTDERSINTKFAVKIPNFKE